MAQLSIFAAWLGPQDFLSSGLFLNTDIDREGQYNMSGRKEATKIMLRLWLDLFCPSIIFIPDIGYRFRIWGQCRIYRMNVVNLSHPDKFQHTIAAPKVTNLHLAMDKRELLASSCQSKTFPFPKLAGDRTWSWIRTWTLTGWNIHADRKMFIYHSKIQNSCP